MAEELVSGDFVTASVRLVRPLAQGGMGTVWVAEHLALDTQVVVKLMSKEVEQHEGAASRFAREAAIAAAVKSPHVVQVFDSGMTEQGTAYIVMELLEGRDLGATLAMRGRMKPPELARILSQLGKALTKAHRVGIIHRDIKPDNVYLCDVEGDEPFVKLLDFGTAKDDAHAVHSTTLGQLIGTPYYMSPEQILGEPIDHRTDIWSLGVVAYEALTGVRPFDGVTVGAVTLAIHTLSPTPSAIVPELPEALDAWFKRACARAPEERFQTIRGAVAAFQRAVFGESAAPEPSASSLDDLAPAPSSSTVITPVSEALSSSTSSLTATLGASTRARERRTMQWVAGIIGLAAVAATIALIRTNGGDARTPASSAEPVPVVTETPPAPSPGSRGAPLPLELPTASGDDDASSAAHARAAPPQTALPTFPPQAPARPAFTTFPPSAPPRRPPEPSASASSSAPALPPALLSPSVVPSASASSEPSVEPAPAPPPATTAAPPPTAPASPPADPDLSPSPSPTP